MGVAVTAAYDGGMTRRPCEHCRGDLPVRARADARFCSTRCRMAAHRAGAPRELRETPRWVRHSKKKVPLTVAGTAASSTDPATWSRFEDVRRFERRGFVLNGDGIVCIDLDHCFVEGRLSDMASRLLEKLPPTYIEVSPSGEGLHVWGRGVVEKGRCLPGGVEVYGTGRFMTVTGRRFGRCPAVLEDLSGVLAELMS